MNDMMVFPASVEEFMEQYKMTDTDHVYSNGIEYVPIYRMRQWFEHCRNQQRPVRHGQWISVKDKLPEKDGQYLIFTTQYFTPDHIDEIDHKDGIEISGYCKRYGFLSENGLHAKYWRDIPQPPKGDKHMDNYELTPNTTTLENSYDEHIIKVEITFIGEEPKSAEEIKKLLGADHVLIKSTKVFHHKRRNRRK